MNPAESAADTRAHESSAMARASIITPPALCTHLPSERPIVDETTMKVRITAADSTTNQLLVRIHAALGPIAYER